MAQTGVPFGDVEAVRDWMGIQAPVKRPAGEHPRVPVMGFACHRREGSGKRWWGWARERAGTADEFFTDFFVWNYPLPLLDEGAAWCPTGSSGPIARLIAVRSGAGPVLDILGRAPPSASAPSPGPPARGRPGPGCRCPPTPPQPGQSGGHRDWAARRTGPGRAAR
jgi:hypothetical protein